MASNKTIQERKLRWRYAVRYLIGMALVAASIIVGAFQLHHVLELNQQQAEIINTAADQTMLVQRVAQLPEDIADDPGSMTSRSALRTLRMSVRRMRQGHTFLTEGTDGAPPPAMATEALQEHYAPRGRGLKNLAESYIRTLEAFAENPTGRSEAIAFQRINAETGLLVRLDQAVRLYTQAAEAEMVKALQLHGFWVLCSLGLIIVVTMFIFRPLARDAAHSQASMREELDHRTKMLARSFQIANIGHWHATNREADPIWMSQELLDMYGLDEKEGEIPLAVIQRGDIVADGEPIETNTQHLAFKRTWDTGEPTVARSQYRKANGDIMDMLVHMDAERDETGTVVAVTGVIKDVTNEARSERALREGYRVIERKSRSLTEAQRLGNTATWRLPLNGTHYDWDERTFELLRFDLETFEPSRENVLQLFSESNRAKIFQTRDDVLANGQSTNIDVQMTRGDNTIADVRVSSKLETDDNGAPVALFGTIQDISKEKAAERELEQLAYFDNLTGLSNRTLFKRELNRICEASARDGTPAALLLIDLDHFKEVNDTLGHLAGDQLLGVVGQRLAQIVGKDDFVARLGGDEFAIIVSSDVSKEQLDSMCDTIINSVERSAQLHLGDVQTRASIGIALVAQDSSVPDELMRFADLALYASKENGRGRASYFDPSLSADLGARMKLAAEIRSALADSRFETHYQPLVELKTGRVSAFETLLRLPKPGGGYIPPDEFIPIAESSHLIADLGAFVLNQACLEAKSWIDAGLPPRRVAVNVSAAQVWHGDLEQVVQNALAHSQLPPNLLCIELTESVFAADCLARLEGILTRLKAQGIVLALDDFGTGYSSLGYLNRLPFDKLKIDRTFVSGANLSAEKQKMLRGVVSLGKGLDLTVVAEGVETEEELQLVRDLGCDKVQGWYFGKASPASQAVVEAARIESMAVLTSIRDKRIVAEQNKKAASKKASTKPTVSKRLVPRTGTA